jgi:hypothetical protein
VRGEKLFPPDEFAPIIGGVIHNLRGALDLAVAVIMRNAGLPFSDKNVQFPTAARLFTISGVISGSP